MSHRWNTKNIWCDNPAANTGVQLRIVNFIPNPYFNQGGPIWKNGKLNFKTA